jgi:glycosyltransferase involved in cell wall biosynthesis
MITHNRRAYTELALERLLACEGDFSVWIWDNGSTDGCTELVRSMESQPHVGRVFLSPDNVMQGMPFEWMLKECGSAIVGKVDNDCLMPKRWLEPLSRAICERPELGVIGCWTFWPEDFDETIASRKIQRFGDHRIVTNAYIGGTGLLVRTELCHRFPVSMRGGIPIEQYRMSAAGFVNGWYYPLIWAEHMDDPRSSHCVLGESDGMTGTFALTALRRGHKTPQEYEQWIREDCRGILTRTTQDQLRVWRRKQFRTAPLRAARSVKRFVRNLWQKTLP